MIFVTAMALKVFPLRRHQRHECLESPFLFLCSRYRNDNSMNADNLHDNTSSGGILDRMQSAYTAVRNWWRNAGEMIQEGDELEHIFEGK